MAIRVMFSAPSQRVVVTGERFEHISQAEDYIDKQLTAGALKDGMTVTVYSEVSIRHVRLAISPNVLQLIPKRIDSLKDYIRLDEGERYFWNMGPHFDLRARGLDSDPIPQDFLEYLGWEDGEPITVDYLLNGRNK